MSAESFTVLAILEARDRASEIFAKVDESLDRFTETATRAGETARAAGTTIDEGLLKTASGADALDVASARVDAAQEKAARTAELQADAERNLMEAHKAAAAAADDDVAAQYRLMEADQKMTAAAKENAAAQKQLSAAQKVQADTAAAAAAKDDAAAAGQKRLGDSAKASAIGLGAVAKVAGITAAGMGVAGALMVRAAGNFQDSTTHLVTDAGESAKNLALVQAGILQVSTATGQSAKSITDAMYHIESGGFHAQAGLNMLKVAAQGARVGGADLDTVTFALVGAMNAYKGAGYSATQMMNALIATTAAGDLRMQDLASSLHNVAPVAAAAHISFAQIGAAIATMTAQGMSAQQATQDLGHVISSLSNPTNVMTAEMNQFGLNASDVASHLGQRGLTGTIGVLTQAITSHMGRGGQVLMSAFTESTTAAQALRTMLGTMPPQFKAMAQGFMSGKVSAKEWRAELQQQTPVNAHLMTQFANLFEKTHSFNAALAAGGAASQTYQAALAKMTGGQMGMNTLLMLSGDHMKDFAAGANSVGKALSSHATDVENWSTIQSTFNFKLDSAKTALENTGIAIGSALLPAATSLMQVITSIVAPIAEWTAKHKTLTVVLFGGVAALAATVAAVALVAKAYKAITGTVDTVKKGLQLVGLISKESAAEQAASAEASAAAQETAAVESSGSWVASAARTVAAWAATAASMIGQAAVWVAANTAKIAVVVAENVAGAAVTMAAWIAANAAMLLGIGLIIAAVIAAVVLIVKHWSQISAFAKKVFDDVVDAVKVAINWVKSHWPLLLAILTGPIGLAVYAIIHYWHDITAGIAAVVDWVRSHWPLLLAIITGPIGLATLYVVKHWDQIVHGAQSMIGDVEGFFRSLPGRILHALGDLANLLFPSGSKIVQGLINGVMSMVGKVESVVGGVVNTIKSYLPFSPAKKGPLSGSGAPEKSGAAITANIARGMTGGIAGVTAAARRVATAASVGAGTGISSVPALSAVAPGGRAGGGNVIIDVHDNHVMSDADINKLIHRIGKEVAVHTLPQAGVRVRF